MLATATGDYDMRK